MVPPVEDSASAFGYEGEQGLYGLKTGQPVVECPLQSVMNPNLLLLPFTGSSDLHFTRVALRRERYREFYYPDKFAVKCIAVLHSF